MATMIDKKARERVYIPIWLDLLSQKHRLYFELFPRLHSNMVRFIITYDPLCAEYDDKFTFQYG